MLAQSIVRFARAFHDRSDNPTAVLKVGSASIRGKRFPRNLDEYVMSLPAATREVLLLHHAYGLELARVARLTQKPLPTVREHLRTGQRGLVDIGAGRALDGQQGFTGVEQWLLLRDRAMYGEGLSPVLARELARLSVEDGAVRLLVRRLEELVQFPDGAGRSSLSAADRALVRRALAAVAVSSAAASARRLDQDQHHVEPEPSGWVPVISVGLCVLMVLLAAGGLAFQPASPALGSVSSDADFTGLGHRDRRSSADSRLSSSGRAQDESAGSAAREAASETDHFAASTAQTASEALETAPEASAASMAQPAPQRLFAEARRLSEGGHWKQAAKAYLELISRYPESEEGHIALVQLGLLRLEHLQQPVQALAAFELYLGNGGGILEEVARYGRVLAFRRFHRPAEERAAIDDFIARHPRSAHVPALRARRDSLAARR